jgi:hypothetical protein
MNELREKAKEFAIKYGLFTTDKKLFESGVGVVFNSKQWNQFLDELTSLVDKPKVGAGDSDLLESVLVVLENPYYNVGTKAKEVVKLFNRKKPVTQTPNLEELRLKFKEMWGTWPMDIDGIVHINVTPSQMESGAQKVWDLFTPLLATKEHDDKIRKEAVREFIRKEIKGVGGLESSFCDWDAPRFWNDRTTPSQVEKWVEDKAEEYLKSLSGDTK